jgi:hypothetical protein
MTFRQSGSIASFRNFVAEHDPVGSRGGRRSAPHRIAAWTLSKLGHAEFESRADGEGWRIAPPVLAVSAMHGVPEAVLCGARSEPLLADLERAAAQPLLRRSHPDSPDVIQLRAESTNALFHIARDAGIPLQWNAPLAILATCQRVGAIALEERAMPIGAGWTISRFSKSRLAWMPCTAAEARLPPANLLRFRSEFGTTYILNVDGRSWSCDPAVGKYRVLTRRYRPLSYNATAQELTIAASCRPPELVERALVVSSGLLPEVRGSKLIYSCVTSSTAAAVATILGQRLH